MVAQQSPKLKERVRFLPPVPILVWPSLVRRLVWDQKIAGSNPATKTNYVGVSGMVTDRIANPCYGSSSLLTHSKICACSLTVKAPRS